MQLIVITPDENRPNEIEAVNHLLEAGLKRLHIRKPGFGIRDYSVYISAIDHRFHDLLVLCGAHELFNEFSLGGVHLSSYDRGDPAVWQKVGDIPPSSISTSVHAWQEIESSEFPYGYVFISPVFDSISKKGYRGSIDLNGAKRTREILAQQGRYCPAIIGLGGVGPGQVQTLGDYGFNGAAVLGAIWNTGDPVANFKAINVSLSIDS